jgi:16S rRNA (cytosine967-C5)-methyltransferase
VGGDAARPPLRGGFATVLLDAPCSGLGTLARHPDIRWRATPDDLTRQAARQRALLEGLAPLVRPGGLLVYSVCSLEPEEGPALVSGWLATQPGFSLSEPPAWATSFVEDGSLGTTPERDESEGFFAALLRRA